MNKRETKKKFSISDKNIKTGYYFFLVKKKKNNKVKEND